MNYLQLYFGYFIFILSASLHICAQSITGVDHFQEGQHIRIVYELQTSEPVEIQLAYSKDFGKTFSKPLQQVSGAVGKGITAGSQEIIWRVPEDVLKLAGEGIMFQLSIAGGDKLRFNGTPAEVVKVGEDDYHELDTYIECEQVPIAVNMADFRKCIAYPLLAKEHNITGKVILKVRVNKEGNVDKYFVVKSPHSILSDVCISQVKVLKFTPAIQDGKPINFWMIVPIDFR
jgi:TonB family protein